MIQGTVKWFDCAKGFGFICYSQGQVFFHRNCVVSGLLDARKGCPVRFDIERVDGKDQAVYVEIEQISSVVEKECEYEEHRLVIDYSCEMNRDGLDVVRDQTENWLRFLEKAQLTREYTRRWVYSDCELLIRFIKRMSKHAKDQAFVRLISSLEELLSFENLDFSVDQMHFIQDSLDQFKELSFEANSLSDKHDSLDEKVAPDLLEKVLNSRSGNLLLVLDRIVHMANRSAILRTAEALGIQNVWIILPDRVKMRSKGIHNKISKRSQQWLSIESFSCIESCIQALQRGSWEIWATELHAANSIPLSAESFTSNEQHPDKLAIVVGSEAHGVSSQITAISNRLVYFPMRGFTESLNVSVATALIIQRILDIFPHLKGSISKAEKDRLRERWHQLNNSVTSR